MTPSNPDNQQPLIYRIADAVGVFHLVAPVDHHHTQAEIDGLAAALTGKANAIPEGSPSGAIVIAKTSGELSRSSKTILDLLSAIAAKQDALTFDSTPTTGSTNPVTSGGVAAALDGKQDALTFDSTPTTGSTNPVTSGGVKTALDNKTSIGNAYMDSKVKVEVKHIEDDEYDQATVIGGNRIVLGVGTDAEDGEAIINANNITNLQRALLNPDTTPTANSSKLVTSGGVKAALDGKQATLTFDTTPTANSTNPVTSGGVKAAIDALLTNYIPVHQVIAILPKTSNQQSPYDAQSWLGNGKMAFVLHTSRSVRVYVDARGYSDAPDSTGRTESTDIYFDLQQGTRTVKNLYDLMSAALSSDYPDFNFTCIDQWKIAVKSLDTEFDDTMCVINVYNPTSSE